MQVLDSKIFEVQLPAVQINGTDYSVKGFRSGEDIPNHFYGFADVVGPRAQYLAVVRKSKKTGLIDISVRRKTGDGTLLRRASLVDGQWKYTAGK
jgi:hypothetical protein